MLLWLYKSIDLYAQAGELSFDIKWCLAFAIYQHTLESFSKLDIELLFFGNLLTIQ